jgi:hypothetical protein
MTDERLPRLSFARPLPITRANRELARRVDEAAAEGTVSAARVEAASFVAQVAMHHIGLISDTEERMTRRFNPVNVARFQAVADSLAALSVGELEQLRLRGWRS